MSNERQASWLESGRHTNSTRQASNLACNLLKCCRYRANRRISPWCTRKCHSPRAPHSAGGQSRCGYSNPGYGATFPG
ncbi:hypothetical protein TNCV_1100201 [Trichonephila clavipes]|nr:hypothetical protein TNCV_1100201 [Trichonephila clavipes]